MSLTLAILAGLATAAVLWFLIRLATQRSKLARSLAFPLHVGAFVAGLEVFSLFEIPRVRAAVPQLDLVLSAVFVFLIAVVALRLLALLFFDLYLHATQGVRLPPLLPRVVTGFAYLIGALVVVKLFWPEQEMGALVATSAVTSLVLGLALQPILGNFFAGIVISLEKPFRINDWILFQDTEARVVEINWRTTHLRTRDNDNLVIPNGMIANEQITNFFYPHPLHLERIYVGVHYKTPPYRVKQAILDAIAEVPSILEKPSPEVYLHSFDDSAITYEVRIWIEDIAHRPRISSHLKSMIWEKFQRRHITIPYPIRTLEIEPARGQLELVRGQRRQIDEIGETAFPAKLFVARGPDRGRTVALRGTDVTVGRSGESDLVLTEARASGNHFSVVWQPEIGYEIQDNESRNGTLVNEQPIETQVLAHLDRVQIGETVIVFESSHV